MRVAAGIRVVAVLGAACSASGTPLTGVSGFGARGATHLAFTVQPTSTFAGGLITPAVQVAAEDATGQPDTTFASNIVVAIGANPGGATLSGTLGVAAQRGVATFSNLSLNHAGTSYTLVATSSGLTTATSASFNITP
jgi:hypothetical protein